MGIFVRRIGWSRAVASGAIVMLAVAWSPVAAQTTSQTFTFTGPNTYAPSAVDNDRQPSAAPMGSVSADARNGEVSLVGGANNAVLFTIPNLNMPDMNKQVVVTVDFTFTGEQTGGADIGISLPGGGVFQFTQSHYLQGTAERPLRPDFTRQQFEFLATTCPAEEVVKISGPFSRNAILNLDQVLITTICFAGTLPNPGRGTTGRLVPLPEPGAWATMGVMLGMTGLGLLRSRCRLRKA